MEMILEFMYNNPNLAGVLVVMAVFRAIFKPIMTLLETYVEATPSTSDNEKLDKFKQSKAYAFMVWFVDYLTSIKLKKPDAKPEVKE